MPLGDSVRGLGAAEKSKDGKRGSCCRSWVLGCSRSPGHSKWLDASEGPCLLCRDASSSKNISELGRFVSEIVRVVRTHEGCFGITSQLCGGCSAP